MRLETPAEVRHWARMEPQSSPRWPNRPYDVSMEEAQSWMNRSYRSPRRKPLDVVSAEHVGEGSILVTWRQPR